MELSSEQIELLKSVKESTQLFSDKIHEVHSALPEEPSFEVAEKVWIEHWTDTKRKLLLMKGNINKLLNSIQ
jgi:hypothetical protein